MATACLSAGFSFVASPANATFPGENGEISFDYTVSAANHSTYHAETASGQIVGFGHYTGARFGQSSWSPDGTKLAVVEEGVASGGGAILIWEPAKDTTGGADPGETTRITGYTPALSSPTWSPDGTQIAYSDGSDIWRMDAVLGATPVNLTSELSPAATEPDWSPDGTKIAYTSPVSGALDVFTMNASDGTDKFNVTQNASRDESPSWSPDGTKLAFSSQRDDASGDIYTTLANGAGSAFRVENRPAIPDLAPAWSPDGIYIAFSSAVPVTGDPGRRNIYAARADGTGDPDIISEGGGRDDNPAWGRVQPKCNGLTPTVLGTEANETLTGTSGDDVILGMGGNDVIVGGDGKDTICGGTGNDTLVGGDGADTFIGGTGTDTVSYSSRTTAVKANVSGGTGDDGGTEDGGVGERDTIGIDVERLIGGSGNDSLSGNSLVNQLLGLGGNDTLLGGGGNDTLSGGAGDDTLSGSTGADLLDGGTGTDTVSYTDRTTSTGGVVVTIDNIANDGSSADGPSTARDNISPSVENLTGGTGNDTLKGSSIANRLIGMKGADRLYGSGGNDTLLAKDGVKDVTLDGGTGTDAVGRDSFDPAPVNVP